MLRLCQLLFFLKGFFQIHLTGEHRGALVKESLLKLHWSSFADWADWVVVLSASLDVLVDLFVHFTSDVDWPRPRQVDS